MYHNKQKNRSSNAHLGLLCIFLCLVTKNVWASFDVVGEDTDSYYGNGETRIFKDAVEGTDTLSPQDSNYLNAVETTRVTQRGYMRLLLGKPRVKMSDFTVFSNNPAIAAPPISASVQSDLYQLLLAGGYRWENWAAEMELLFSKKLNQTLNPIAVGVPFQATFKLNQFAAFFNLQYIIPHWFSFYPSRLQIHLDAGVGPALKNTSTSVFALNGTPVQSQSNRTISGAGNLGVGFRYQVTASFLVDVAYRYFYLGKVTFGPVQSLNLQSKKLQSAGLFIGATYQF